MAGGRQRKTSSTSVRLRLCPQCSPHDPLGDWDGHAAIDRVQEHIIGQDQQSNESAAEQLKDEQISDICRRECANPQSLNKLRQEIKSLPSVLE